MFVSGADVSELASQMAAQQAAMPAAWQLLGNFIDCHDTDRFLCLLPDVPLFKCVRRL